MRTLAAFLCLTAFAHAAPYQLRVEKTGWGEAGHADLSKVLHSSCDAIAQHLGDIKLPEPLRARYSKDGPISLYKRSVRGEIIIELSSRDRLWSQHAYQIAHEFGHVLCGFREGGTANNWFEESLCELASIFAMRSMADSWKTAPPYRNWKSYANALRDYITKVEEKHHLPAGQTLARYVSEHRAHFRKNATDRPKNGIVALALLPLFEAEPTGWQSLRYLNAGRGKEALPFDQHLKNWHDQAPKQHHEFIKKVAEALGLPIRPAP